MLHGLECDFIEFRYTKVPLTKQKIVFSMNCTGTMGHPQEKINKKNVNVDLHLQVTQIGS